MRHLKQNNGGNVTVRRASMLYHYIQIEICAKICGHNSNFNLTNNSSSIWYQRYMVVYQFVD